MKKRKIILCCFAAIFLALSGVSLFMMKKKRDFRRTIAVIPEFCLLQVVDSFPFCSAQLDKGKPVIMMYFHPECDFCHVKAQYLQKTSANGVGDIQWIMVSYAEKDSLIQFIETYNLDEISGLTVLLDSQLSLYDRLQVAGIPTSFIYDRRHRLVAVKRGETKLETMIRLAMR